MTQASEPLRGRDSLEEDLKERIMRFCRDASMEIAPSDEKRLPELVALLSPGTAIYVAHPPKATFEQVVQTAFAVQRAGFMATPHIVARRINYPHTLRVVLSRLRAGGVEQILVIAGDTERASGEFESTLDIFKSGILDCSGLSRIGVAAHPEGHRSVKPSVLRDALKAKQAFAERTGLKMFLVTQFGLKAQSIAEWETELTRHDIRLPVRVGIAGPTPLSKLIHFAMLCGIGASIRTVMHNLSAVGNIAELATTPDQHVMRLVQLPSTTQVIAPHFFSFGGVLETARWINRVSAGAFEMDVGTNKFRVEG